MLILIIVAIPLLGEALVFSLSKHRGHETAHAVIGKIVTDSVTDRARPTVTRLLSLSFSCPVLQLSPSLP